MAKPVIVFPDAVLVGLTALREGPFADLPEVVAADLSVSRSIPDRDVYTAHPALSVSDDGDAGGTNRVTEEALLRISVWDMDAFRGLRLARLARAYLLAYGGSPASRGFSDASHPFSTEDPDDGTPLASFTITARLRPE